MLVSLALSFVACAPPPPPPEEKPSCAVTLDALDGTKWVYLEPQATGASKANPMARLTFSGKADALTARYTAKDPVNVYDYTCSVAGKIATCIETDTQAEAFCKAWAATHDGVCDAAAVAAAAGIPQGDVDKVVEAINKELKALKGEAKETQRKVDNSPNNKIRAKFKVSVDPGSCQLAVEDKYITMVDGKVQEYENVIGAGRFEKTDVVYSFAKCTDTESAWAPSAKDPNAHETMQSAGPVTFAATLTKGQKADKACTYTADIYKDWQKVGTVEGKADPKLGVRWETTVPFTDAGVHAVYFDRKKTCGGAAEDIGLACSLVKVQ